MSWEEHQPPTVPKENHDSNDNPKLETLSKAKSKSASRIQNEFRYGWCNFTPDNLQSLNNVKFLVATLFIAQALHIGIGDSLPGVTISTLEKRFALNSYQSSLIVGIYDFAALFSIIIFTYLGDTCHRIRWTAIGIGVMGFGCMLFTLPHFTAEPYVPTGTALEDYGLCVTDQNIARCEAPSNTTKATLVFFRFPEYLRSFPKGNLAFFLFARFLMGTGYIPLNVQALTFLHSCDKKNYPMHMGLRNVGGLVGIALAYGGGGFTLRLYTNFLSEDPEKLGLSHNDSRYVGAWWLGFAIASFIFLLTFIAMSGFPRQLPHSNDETVQLPDALQMNSAANESRLSNISGIAKQHGSVFIIPSNFRNSTRHLAGNVTFWSLIVINAGLTNLTASLGSYGPKILQTQFGMHPTLAGVVFGIVFIPCGATGYLLGGWAITRWNLDCHGMMKAMACVTLPIVLGTTIFFVSCESYRFSGVNVGYLNNKISGLSDQCHMGCQCDDLLFTPVCGSDNHIYYSPCHAGCRERYDLNRSEVLYGYRNCSCIPNSGSKFEAKSGQCESNSCTVIVPFLFTIGLAIVLLSTTLILHCAAIMSAVKSSTHWLALSVNSMGNSLGGITGPLMFGYAFDVTCDLWEENCAGETGACMANNRHKLGVAIFLMTGGTMFLCFVAATIGWKWFVEPEDPISPPPIMDIPHSKTTESPIRRDVTPTERDIPFIDRGISPSFEQDFTTTDNDEFFPANSI